MFNADFMSIPNATNSGQAKGIILRFDGDNPFTKDFVYEIAELNNSVDPVVIFCHAINYKRRLAYIEGLEYCNIESSLIQQYLSTSLGDDEIWFSVEPNFMYDCVGQFINTLLAEEVTSVIEGKNPQHKNFIDALRGALSQVDNKRTELPDELCRLAHLTTNIIGSYLYHPYQVDFYPSLLPVYQEDSSIHQQEIMLQNLGAPVVII